MPRVERLDLAVLRLPDWHPAAATSRSIPVYGYLIEHPDGAIVVDTGVGEGNSFIDEAYEPSRLLLDEALLACGVEPTAVVAVVNSHLHFDHCGQNPLLHGCGASFIVQQAELDAVAADPLYTVARWAVAPTTQQRVANGDEVIADGITVLATPGHTVGHQSVLIEAGDERIIIGAQVVWDTSEFESEEASAANVDPVDDLRVAAVESIRRLKALNPHTVHFSHCPPHRSDEAPEPRPVRRPE